MKIRHKLRLSGLLAALSVGLTACDPCEDTYCPPCSPFSTDVVVRFDDDSLRGGLRKAEIRSAYLVRYARPGFATALDTLRQRGREFNFYPQPLSLQTLPWSRQQSAPAVTGDFTIYNYRFVVPAVRRTHEMSNLEVKTEASGGRCDCGTNVRRRFVLNGRPVIANGSENQERGIILH